MKSSPPQALFGAWTFSVVMVRSPGTSAPLRQLPRSEAPTINPIGAVSRHSLCRDSQDDQRSVGERSPVGRGNGMHDRLLRV